MDAHDRGNGDGADGKRNSGACDDRERARRLFVFAVVDGQGDAGSDAHADAGAGFAPGAREGFSTLPVDTVARDWLRRIERDAWREDALEAAQLVAALVLAGCIGALLAMMLTGRWS